MSEFEGKKSQTGNPVKTEHDAVKIISGASREDLQRVAAAERGVVPLDQVLHNRSQRALLLPILNFKEQIVQTINSSAVTVITAETGAGKSTQVPQYLLEAGYRIVVTQPRRPAARTVAARVAEERREKLGGVVGYRTSEERVDSELTRALFCTDGLALVRELMRRGGDRDVLVLDEVHEWNLNIEVLAAWAKREIELGGKFKLVLMSATLEAEKLSAFYNNAPVIEVPGRTFPVTISPCGRSLGDDVASLVREGRNVLVFQPGKAEIAKCISGLQFANVEAEIMPLHGEQEPGDQNKCLKHYDRPKVVVATNVAQTSITIDDIDAVVDTGLEKRVEVIDGVEGLYLRPISLADSKQRCGRAGRTKPGVYIDCCPTTDRLEFPKAEILRVRLDMAVLRLLMADIDMEQLNLFHQPPREAIQYAKRALVALGCITPEGEVTKVGRSVARLPLSANIGRMVVEAMRLGVLEDVITIAAIIEVGGIVDRRVPEWRAFTGKEQESDLLAQLAVFKAAGKFKRDSDPEKDEFRKNGVFAKMFLKVKKITRNIKSNALRNVEIRSTGSREDILKAVCAGMVDHLYQHAGYGALKNGGADRQMARESVVRLSYEDKWVVGSPFDLEITTRRGKMTLRLLTLASKVKVEWLTEIAPQLVSQEPGINPRFSEEKDLVVSTTKKFFNGKLVEETVDDGVHPQAAEIFAAWLARRMSLSTRDEGSSKGWAEVLSANCAQQIRARELNTRAGEKIFPVIEGEELKQFFLSALTGARNVREIKNPEALRLSPLDEKKISEVVRLNPDEIELLGEQLKVEYQEPRHGSVCSPRVALTEQQVQAKAWMKLPDGGVTLPNGRAVEVGVNFGYRGALSDTDIPRLKERVREYLNHEQWDRWAEKPAIDLPDPAVEGSAIPLVTAVYGRCVVTGEELVAFGTAQIKAYRYSTNDPYFQPAWYSVESDAKTTRDSSVQFLEGVRAEARKQRAEEEARRREEAEREQARAEAEIAREDLLKVTRHEGWYDLERKLREEAEGRRYAYLPTSSGEISDWTGETKALKAKVEEALKENRLRREAQAQAQAEAERIEREELTVIIDVIGDDLARAQRIRSFAVAVEEIVGATRGLTILRRELNAPYGRGARQLEIEKSVPAIGETDAGRMFLSVSRARDVDVWLDGAARWLEANAPKAEAPSTSAKAKQKPETKTSTGSLGTLADLLAKAKRQN